MALEYLRRYGQRRQVLRPIYDHAVVGRYLSGSLEYCALTDSLCSISKSTTAMESSGLK